MARVVQNCYGSSTVTRRIQIFTLGGRADRNHIIGTPVFHEGLVYIAVGEDPEHGEGVGHLWCIDPTKRGDTSPELAVSLDDPDTPLPHRRLQAVIKEEGEVSHAPTQTLRQSGTIQAMMPTGMANSHSKRPCIAPVALSQSKTASSSLLTLAGSSIAWMSEDRPSALDPRHAGSQLGLSTDRRWQGLHW
jgi:hypothetical protein